MALKSNDILILFVGAIIAFFISFTPNFNKIEFNNFTTVYIFLFLVLVGVAMLLWAFNQRTNEFKTYLDSMKVEQKRLGEKLKIDERLAKIEVKLGL